MEAAQWCETGRIDPRLFFAIHQILQAKSSPLLQI